MTIQIAREVAPYFFAVAGLFAIGSIIHSFIELSRRR